MAKYAEDDCRNHGGPIVGKPLMMEFVHEVTGITRSERRRRKHFMGRKNTVGVPIGYNVKTWGAFCASNASERKEQEVIK